MNTIAANSITIPDAYTNKTGRSAIITITIKKGTKLAEKISLHGVNLSHVIVKAEDKEVLVSNEVLVKSYPQKTDAKKVDYIVDSPMSLFKYEQSNYRTTFIYLSSGAISPLFLCTFTLDKAPSGSSWNGLGTGIHVTNGSLVRIGTGGGMKNFTNGVYADLSTVDITYATFTNSSWGVCIDNASKCSMVGCSIVNCKEGIVIADGSGGHIVNITHHRGSFTSTGISLKAYNSYTGIALIHNVAT